MKMTSGDKMGAVSGARGALLQQPRYLNHINASGHGKEVFSEQRQMPSLKPQVLLSHLKAGLEEAPAALALQAAPA